MKLRVVTAGGALLLPNDDVVDDVDNRTPPRNPQHQQFIKQEQLPHDLNHHHHNDAEIEDAEMSLAICRSSDYQSTTPFSAPQLLQGKRKIKTRVVMDPTLSLPVKIRKKPSSKSKLVRKEKAKVIGSSTPAQVMSPTFIRAEEVQSSLAPEFPSFLKLLVRSHVASCFWMGLPTPFCKLHLPSTDAAVVLETENGELFEIKYIADKTGLSAGWRKFAVGHKLLEGDVLLFHLVEPLKFKVYIIRQNDLTEVDGALSLLNLDLQTKQLEAANENVIGTSLKIKKRKRPNLVSLKVAQKKNKIISLSGSVPELGQLVEQSGNDSEEVGSEVLEGSKFTRSSIPFKNVNSFEDFHIVVNGLCVDSELPEHIRLKYYELCCKKNAYLHNRFLPGLYSKLIAGIIGETVNIADAIKGCKLTTSWDEFAVWEKSLKSFELLGMKVGFLRNRLHTLRNLAFESGGASDVKSYLEAKSERTHIEDEIRNLEVKLVELKAASEKFDTDIEILSSKVEKHESRFQDEVDAPW